MGKVIMLIVLFIKNNLEVFNFRDIFNLNDEYFADLDHLNEIGSKKFQQLLLEKIENDNHKILIKKM